MRGPAGCTGNRRGRRLRSRGACRVLSLDAPGLGPWALGHFVYVATQPGTKAAGRAKNARPQCEKERPSLRRPDCPFGFGSSEAPYPTETARFPDD
jgi:hypothetical protein